MRLNNNNTVHLAHWFQSIISPSDITDIAYYAPGFRVNTPQRKLVTDNYFLVTEMMYMVIYIPGK